MVDTKGSSKPRNKHKRSHRHRLDYDDEEYLLEETELDEKRKHRTKFKDYDQRDNPGHVKIYYDLDELDYSPKHSAKHRDRHRLRNMQEYGFEEYVADEIISESKKHKSDRYRLKYDLEDEEYFTNDSADYKDTSDFYDFNGYDGEKIMYPSKRYMERHEDRFRSEYIVEAEEFTTDVPAKYSRSQNHFDGIEYSDKDEIIYEPERRRKKNRHRVSFDLEDGSSEKKDKRHHKHDKGLERKGSSDTADEDTETYKHKRHKHRVSFEFEADVSEQQEKRHKKSKRRERKGSSDTGDEDIAGYEHKEKRKPKRPGSGRKSDRKSNGDSNKENGEKRKHRRENRKHNSENQGGANKDRRRIVDNEYEMSKEDDRRKEDEKERRKQRERENEERRRKEKSRKRHMYKQDKTYDQVRL